MEYKIKGKVYEAISPGTVGVSQKISVDYEGSEDSSDETSKLVFLSKNNVMSCGQNQY